MNANANKNSDLFKALKGGGSNFGIVTRFDMETIDIGLIWGGLVAYEATTASTEHFVHTYQNWTDHIEDYVDGSVIVFWSYDPIVGGDIIIVAYEDLAGIVAPPAFSEFLSIDPNLILSSSMRVATHKNLADELEIADGYR